MSHDPMLPRLALPQLDANLLSDAERSALVEGREGISWIIGLGRLLRSHVTPADLREAARAAARRFPAAALAREALAAAEDLASRSLAHAAAGRAWEAVSLADDLESLVSGVTRTAVQAGALKALDAAHEDLEDELESRIDHLLVAPGEAPGNLRSRLDLVSPEEGSVAALLLHAPATWRVATGPWPSDVGTLPPRPALTRLSEILRATAPRRRLAAAPLARAATRAGAALFPVASGDTASVMELRVRSAGPGEEGNPWAGARARDAAARNAIVRAFSAAVSLLPRRLPPAPLECHVIELEPKPGEEVAIEGGSLGLAAGLAFLSFWSDTPLRDGIVATGVLDASSPDGTGLSAVGHLDAKLAAVQAIEGGGLLLTVSRDPVAGILSVQTLADATRAAGLPEPRGLQFEPWLGTTSECRSTLRDLLERADSQNLGGSLGWSADPWVVLGSSLHLVARALESSEVRTRADEQLVIEGRIQAALCFLHGSDPEAADAVLEGTARSLSGSNAVSLLTARLARAINALPQSDAECRELERAITRDLVHLEEHERAAVEGRARGTVGRSMLHRGAPEEAILALQAAAAAHSEWEPHELPRSLIYLAGALREAKRLPDAESVLAEAHAGIEAIVRRESHAHAASTLMYWRHEVARLHRALERWEDAAAWAIAALGDAKHLGVTWPQPSVLRTLACVYRGWGWPEEEALAVHALEAMVGEDSPPYYLRLLAEARGEETREIY